jgi:hypothetical protein
MLKRIRSRGVGPFAAARDVEFAPRGRTIIRASSERGKSMLMQSLSLVLWGTDTSGKAFPGEYLTEGLPGADVTVSLASGTDLERLFRVDPDRKHTRTKTTRDGIPYEPSTEKAWAEAIGALGDKDLRFIMFPMEWRQLAEGEGDGRALRDLIVKFTGGAVSLADIVRELAGDAYRTSDVLKQDVLYQMRTNAGRLVDQRTGALQAAEAGLEAASSLTVAAHASPDVLDLARDVLKRRAAWEAFTARHAAWEASKARADAWQAEQTRWLAAVEALGPEPPDLNAQESEARARLREAVEVHAEAKSLTRNASFAVEVVTSRIREAQARFAQVEAEDASDVCPHCKREGWTEAVEDHARRLRSAQEILDQFVVDEKDARAELATLTARTDEAARDLAVREEAVARVVEQARAREAWFKRRRELGSAPVKPVVAGEPEAPEEITEERAAKAQAVLDEDAELRGESRRRDDEIKRLTTYVAGATQAVAQAQAEHDRLDKVLAAVRQAPSVAMQRQLAALGDLGPVTIHPTGPGGVDVRVDGRPWRCASDGRQVVADLWLRAGLRRAVGHSWLPLWVDRAQDVGGQPIPPAAGPVILLETTDDEWSVTLEK